ncbi:MAG: cephalosporin hydroxylase family protein [Burkholderiales bacterium]|nr:cephalosporin hydroxylase family protein [Burkholderiales bacterium]
MPTSKDSTTGAIERFVAEVRQRIEAARSDAEFLSLSRGWMTASFQRKYSYNFSWMGRPVIQYPQDMIAMQEIVWEVKPELIIETGIAHGGSLVYYASLLQLIGQGEVVGIDIDIREHNRVAIERHPMASRIRMIEGSSVAPEVVARVEALAAGHSPVLIVLDSNHTHEHVLAELRAYANLVTVGSYCVVFDTVVEDLPADFFGDRPWGVGDSPRTAVQAFLAEDGHFEIDRGIDAKLGITVAAGGYLRRIR